MLNRFLLVCTVTFFLGTGCARLTSAERQTVSAGDTAVGLLSKQITQLTVNLNSLSKRLAETPPIATEADSTLQELRELDRSGWQLHQKQWNLQPDYLVFARDEIERAQQRPGEKPQLLEQWRQRRQEFQTALKEIHEQRQQLEQKHLEAEARLVERLLQ
jgi:predicted  nucleic acid-binding Zn-ribbon protein